MKAILSKGGTMGKAAARARKKRIKRYKTMGQENPFRAKSEFIKFLKSSASDLERYGNMSYDHRGNRIPTASERLADALEIAEACGPVLDQELKKLAFQYLDPEYYLPSRFLSYHPSCASSWGMIEERGRIGLL